MQNNQRPQLPAAINTAGMSIAELMKLASRLSDILQQENKLLERMRISEAMAFAEEKTKLSQRLESYQKVMATDPSFLAAADPATRETLLDTTDNLAFAIEENMHRTLVARAANQRVMETITEALSEHRRLNTYGRNGQTANAATETISINLNQQA